MIRTSLTLILMFLAMSAAASGGAVQYEVADQQYEGYYVSPGEDAPLVLLIHDWDGLTDYEVKRAGMLAEMGYAVFAADLFGAGIRPEDVDHRRALTGNLYENRDQMRALLQGALEAAASKGANTGNTVAVGYCFGGAAVLELARSGADLKGFATFHGGLSTPEGQNYGEARGRYLILHGSADTGITMDQFAALGAQLEKAGLEHELISYGGAPHAWTVFGSSRYREDADEKSWAAFSRFLEDTLK